MSIIGRYRYVDSAMAVITLITDFGSRDHYVACLKGVILGIAPDADLVDVTHDIPRHDILRGAFILRQALHWFPRGAIHLAVIDPSVGTHRRILAARYADQFVIAPDNGLLSFVHHQWPAQEVRVLENPRFALPVVSSTFHGRDIMAPAAAHLASGARLADVGPLTQHLEVLPLARPELLRDYALRGRIIYVDAFGNLVTNLTREQLIDTYRHRPQAAVYLNGTSLGPLRAIYAEVPVGQPLALIGSCDLLEIAVNGGSAAAHFHPAPDAAVEVR